MVSTQFTINYGAVLQAYSLQRSLTKAAGEGSVEVINYSPKSARYGHFESYSFSSLKSSLVSICKLFNPIYRRSRKDKIQAFSRFLRKEFFLTKTEYVDGQELSATDFRYDIVFVGSDQVWNHRVIDDEVFKLNFVDGVNTKKVSFAASIGGAMDGSDLDCLCKHLIDFKEISLREPTCIDDIERLTNKKVEVLMDPVFLTSREEWLGLSKSSDLPVEKKYILVYEVNSPPGFGRYVQYLKENSEYGIVVLSTRPFPKYRGVSTISNASPYDYVRLFSKAEFVLTSSFHGVAFSCILNIPFSCVLNSERSERQRSLLDTLDLGFCDIFEVESLRENMQRQFNWSGVNEKIKKEVAKSRRFIARALDRND